MLDSSLKLCAVPSPPPHLLTDLEVKVTDLEFFKINEMSISHQSVIKKYSSFKYKNFGRVCFHSITTDPRVHAMGWGWRSKYRTSSYSSNFEFIFFLFQMHFSFIGKAQFRQATMFCKSSYYFWLISCYGGVWFCLET